MSTFNWPPISGGNGVAIYPTFSAFPPTATTGTLAVAADTGNLYEFNGTSWVLIGSPTVINSIGTIDSQSPSANGAVASGNVLYMQSASGSFPGLVKIGNLTDAGTDGITITGGTGAVVGTGTSIAQHVADTTHNGYLSSTDWNTFNSKQSALTIGNLTDAGTDGITITGGTGSVIGTGTSIAQRVADTTHNGYLSSTDWNTFNSKQPALTIGNLTDAGTDGITITGGTGAVIGTGTSIAQHVADTTHNGYLSSTDWNTFNGKGSGSVTSVGLSVPASSLFSVTGTPVTTSGTLGLVTTGTSGGIPYFSSTSQLNTSALLTANQLVLGGGAGTAPATLGSLGTSTTVLHGNASGAPTFGAVVLTTDVSGTLPVGNGGTGVTSVTVAPTATAFAGWDANKNLSANNNIFGYRTTATAAGTTTLVVGDAYQQYFTGTTTQTVQLPVTSTLVNGQSYLIVNNSTGNVTVQSSGGNTLQVMSASTQLIATVISTSGTGTASWSWAYTALGSSIAGISPTVQTFTSGSGTYTTPAGVKYIQVTCIGGGAGGAGSGSTNPAGTSGNNTTFGALTAGGGSASGGGIAGGSGGSASGGSVFNIPGGGGGGGCAFPSQGSGGTGGNSWAGGGGTSQDNGVGGAGATNSGGGGGGGGSNSTGFSGAGGGAGGAVQHIYTSPAATYSYSVGASVSGGSAGSSGSAGGNGASGLIFVVEYYVDLSVGTSAAVSANLVMAGPTSGSAAAPTFRSLVTGDLPVGTIVQVISTTLPTTFTTTSTSYTDITGLSLSITPTRSTNKILVLVNMQGSQAVGTNRAAFQLVRGSTAIAVGNVVGSRSQASGQFASANNTIGTSLGISYLDSPATTSSTTYKIQGYIPAGGSTLYVNQDNTYSNDATYTTWASTITALEVQS